MTSHLALNNTTTQLKHQIWRYFVCYLLTPDLSSLITLVIIMFFFVTMFERFMGNICIAVVFFASNILVNFFMGALFEGNSINKTNSSKILHWRTHRRSWDFRSRISISDHQLLSTGQHSAFALHVWMQFSFCGHFG